MQQITVMLHNLLVVAEVVGGFALGLVIYYYSIGAALDVAKRFKRRH